MPKCDKFDNIINGGETMNNLKKERELKKVTLKEVAKEVGIAESQLSFYERGKRQPKDKETWQKLADYYKVSVPYIMGLSNSRNSEDSYIKDEQLKEVKSFNAQQINLITNKLNNLILLLDEADDEFDKSNTLISISNQLDVLNFYISNNKNEEVSNMNTSLNYLFDDLRGIYSTRYLNKENDSESYKRYLILKDGLNRNLDIFFNKDTE